MMNVAFWTPKAGRVVAHERIDLSQSDVTVCGLQMAAMWASRRHCMPSPYWIAWENDDSQADGLRVFFFDGERPTLDEKAHARRDSLAKRRRAASRRGKYDGSGCGIDACAPQPMHRRKTANEPARAFEVGVRPLAAQRSKAKTAHNAVGAGGCGPLGAWRGRGPFCVAAAPSDAARDAAASRVDALARPPPSAPCPILDGEAPGGKGAAPPSKSSASGNRRAGLDAATRRGPY